jgi:hypothetical protein
LRVGRPPIANLNRYEKRSKYQGPLIRRSCPPIDSTPVKFEAAAAPEKRMFLVRKTRVALHASIAPQRAEDEVVMLVQPPSQYAGHVGARARISSVSAQHLCVIFESGIRESFPVGLFAKYFTAVSARPRARNE